MAYHKDIVDARALTADARAAATQRIAESPLANLLPDSFEESEEFRLNVNESAEIASAEYRTWDTEAQFGSEYQTYSLSGRIPPISQKMRLSERGALQVKGVAAIREALLEKARNNGLAIATRSVLARGEVLETGKFTFTNENGLTLMTVDFQRPAEHTVTAAASWAVAGTDVIGDILAWQQVYRGTNGQDAGTVVLSTDIINALQVNKSIINEAKPGVGATRVSPELVRAVLASYGLANVVVNDDKAKLPNGTVKRVVSADKVLLLPATGSSLTGSGIGKTQWGLPGESTNPEYGITGADAAGIISYAYQQNDPEGLFVLGSAVTLPVLQNAKATFVADVLA